MSTTIRNIIRKASRLAGVTAANEDVDSETTMIAQEAISSLLDSWSTNPKFYWDSVVTTFPINSTTSEITFATRPVRVLDVVYRISSTAYPLREIDQRDLLRTSHIARSIPQAWVWTGGLVMKLVGRGEGTIEVLAQMPLVDISQDLDAEFTMPPGYQNAVTYTLAIMLCEEFGRTPSASLIAFAESSIDSLPAQNHRPVLTKTDVAGVFDRRDGGFQYWERESS